MTIIEIISLSVFSIGIMFYSFIKGYSYGKAKEKQKLEVFFLNRGYHIFCCRFDVCPKGKDNTCRGCRLYDECYTKNVPNYRVQELKN